MLKVNAMFASLLAASLVGAFAVLAVARLHVEKLEAGHRATLAQLEKRHLVVLSDLRADYQASADAQRKRTEKDQAQITQNYEGALNAALARQTTLANERNSARAAADSLRQQVATANRAFASRINLPETPGVSVDQYALAGAELLAECGQAVVELAGEADTLAADLKLMVDAWPVSAPAP